MALSKKISRHLIEDDDVPEEIEHDLIKDSILEIANTDFKVSDEFDDLPAGDIRRNIAEDLSTEYEGKPVSRKKFSQANWINDPSDDDQLDSDDNDIDGDNSVESFADDDTGSVVNSDDDKSKELSDQEVGENIEDSANESNEESEDEDTNMKNGRQPDINIFSSRVKNIDEDVKKGNAIKNQLILWENLIECRIKLQKGLAASNRLFQKEAFQDFKSILTPEEETNLHSAYKGLIDLLEKFIQIRECLLKKCPEYMQFTKNSKNNSVTNRSKVKDSDDEEITSDSEDEKNDKSDEENISSDDSPPEKKRRIIDDYPGYLSVIRRDYIPFRDGVIHKWNEKTRLASGKIGISKYAILEQSTLKQIEQILMDKDRLVKRTQTRRSKLPVLGKENQHKEEPEENSKEEDEEEIDDHDNKKDTDETLDCEIFDDDDFYHKLLKDFIDRKTSDVTDPNQLGRQWTKLQKLRSKMKRKVDTRATKGRKIRYTVHNKLVNFMAPVPYSTWDDKVEQDLFRSLFGQASQAPLKVNTPGQ